MIALDFDTCNGCATCAKVCPHGVFTLEAKKAYLTYEERCIECGACQLNCEDGAIEVTKGVGCLFAIIRDDVLRRSPNAAPVGCDTGCGC